MLAWGFQLCHHGGISRAWQRILEDGRVLLVTDEGGFDLPEPDGPFHLIELSPDQEMIGEVVRLGNPLALRHYLGHIL